MNSPALVTAGFAASFALLCSGTDVRAAIISVEETNLGGDAPAIIESGFGEDMLIFSDREHQHNGAAFDSSTNQLNVNGDIIVPLPEYLLNHDYVMFANDARDNANYSATITADVPTIFYLLVDCRLNGLTAPTLKANNSDPVLAGPLQWIVDGGWERVNTGISPDGQPDYTAVDESGDGEGPGEGLNNFMAVYRFPVPATQITVRNNGIGGSNNIAVVGAPAPPPTDPIVSFIGQPAAISPGESTLLTWVIDPAATAATIDQGIGNVLPATGAAGDGSVSVSPQVTTTYTLEVTTPEGTETATAVVEVRPVASFTATPDRVIAGESVTLSWRVRPDATVSIEGIGNVTTGPDGVGAVTVQPTDTRSYVLTASAGGVTQEVSLGVLVSPPGQPFALIDLGATGGRVEPGSVNGRVIGAGAAGENGLDLEEFVIYANDGTPLILSVNCVDPDGFQIGSTDWRDRGNGPLEPLARLAEDFVKNNAGYIRVTLRGLPAGTYDVISWHVDPDFSQSSGMRVFVSDANGSNVDTGVVADASFEGHPDNSGAPQIHGLSTALVHSKHAKFSVRSDGTGEVSIVYDATWDEIDTEATLSGLWLIRQGDPPAPEPTFALLDIGGVEGRPEAGATGGAVIGQPTNTNGADLEPVQLTAAGGVPITVSISNLSPDGDPIGGLDWRDRGDGPDFPLVRLAEDFVKNNAGMIRVTIEGLPEGEYDVISYHIDPDNSQSSDIVIRVTDAAGTAVTAPVKGDASYFDHPSNAWAPGVQGLYPGLVLAKGARFGIRSDGSAPVILYFDSTEDPVDTETTLSGLRLISRDGNPAEPVPVVVTSVTRSVEADGARVAIEFRSTPGATYRVQASTNLATWEVLAPALPAAAGETTTFVESGIPLTTGRRFYRITEN